MTGSGLGRLVKGLRPYWKPRLYGFGGLFLVSAGVGVSLGTWRNLCASCPSIAQIRTFEPEQTSKLFSHDGRLIAEFGIESRTPIAIDSLPDFVAQAFISIEDQRFYSHSGIDARGIARALVGVLTGRNRGGGSTITQQLARNMFIEQIGFERRYVRKLKELQVALALERSYTKDQILEAYINQINYGHGWWGIQTAARNYFGKSAADLDPAEAAMLAAIPNRPATYSPLRNPDRAVQRRNLVLRRMVVQDYLEEDEFERWSAVPVPTERVTAAGDAAPYFVEWVRRILDDRFGAKLYTSGLRVFTTIDERMQRFAELSMEEGWQAIEAREEFEHPKYEEFAELSSNEVILNGATPYVQGLFVALDPWTGHVRAMVGGRNFEHSKFNRATQARRQAGSGFKPFVYGAAIESGIPPNHVLVDAPVVEMQVDGTEWRPQNFSESFRGPITIREGLMRSINMIAIKLAQEVGLESVAQTARRLGIRTEIERFPSTAIGAAEVIPIELAEAYSSFANLGTRVRPFPILRVEDSRGQIIWNPRPERTVAMDSLPARLIVSMLQTVVQEGTGWNAVRNVAGLPYEVAAAGKTGTTNDGTDVWFNGFTPNLLATVWFGMDVPVSVRPNATGGADAAPVWGRFMRRVYYGDADAVDAELHEPALPVPESWPIPDGLSRRVIDKTTGKLASRWCPEDNQRVELFLPGTEPTEFCDREGLDVFRISGEPGSN